MLHFALEKDIKMTAPVRRLSFLCLEEKIVSRL